MLLEKSTLPPLPGYMTPKPVVWASVYPESQDDFTLLKQSLSRLRLSDSSLSFEEESSGTLGRGFRCGFLGMLHLEIVTERLRREFALTLIVTTPTITYDVEVKNGKTVRVYSPPLFPEYGEVVSVSEPWVKAVIIMPNESVGAVMQLLFDHEGEVGETTTFGRAATVALEVAAVELGLGHDPLLDAGDIFEKAAEAVRKEAVATDQLLWSSSRSTARSRSRS